MQNFHISLIVAVLAVPAAERASAQPPAEAVIESQRHTADVFDGLRERNVESALGAFGRAADLPLDISQAIEAGLPAAAGAVHRVLMQRSMAEQYDLLYAWSMPAEGRGAVRILSTPVPQDAPPREFARLLGERPRNTSFPIAEVGGVRGFFSTGWMLVQAADDVGRLSRLTAELQKLSEQGVRNADVLLLLARLADRRSDASPLADELRRRATQEKDGIDPSTIVLAAAALQREELRPVSEEVFAVLVDRATAGPAVGLRPLLRVAHATAVQRHRGVSDPEVAFSQDLKYWVPVSGKTALLSAHGAVDGVWLAHEDHILHLAGARNDVLFFRYPLTGDFDFTCETQEGGAIGTDGGLVYGGLQFQALGSTNQLTVWDADLIHSYSRHCPFVRHEERPTFNRVSIRSTEEGATFAANLHPIWFDGAASKTSPWLGLRSFGQNRPLFRNFKVTGNPVIPREVRMTGGDELRGWQSGFLAETQPLFTPGMAEPQNGAPQLADPVAAPPAFEADWQIAGGVLHARRAEPLPGVPTQSLLRYQRPLLEGESVRYESFHQPGEVDVHPALGRLAFLIEPDGVRIHWITDGPGEWTGLPEDNATLEPLNRRGPRPLPLRENAWNQVALQRAGGKVIVSLNDAVIYERPVDFGGDHTFGFYRDRTQSAARVRNVVMTGDWPDSLPEDFLENPTALAGEPLQTGDRHARNDLSGAEFIAENVRATCRQAARLEPAERYEFLSRWVLPGPEHADFRVDGFFRQTDPSPLALELDPGIQRAARGAELVSPVFDLLDAAAAAGRLAELRDKIAEFPEPATALQQRARAALQTLVHLELGDTEQSRAALVELHTLAAQVQPDTLREQWPETLVVYRAIRRSPHDLPVGDLLTLLYTQRTLRRSGESMDQWHTHVVSLLGELRHPTADDSQNEFAAADGLNGWIPVVRARARSRGQGCAHARWEDLNNNEVHQVAGHQEEYLFHSAPLRGNFTVECDIGVAGTSQVLAAGQFFGPKHVPDLLETGTFRGGAQLQPFAPPFSKMRDWVRYRAVFHQGTLTVFLNGRRVHEERLQEHYDPWIGLRSWWRNGARFRDFRIAGEPEIPESVLLFASPALPGWLPYYDETVGYDSADWQYAADLDGGQIVGSRDVRVAGSFRESLLRYHRPLEPQESVEYEFFYQPDAVLAHPALDRLAFLLHPDGVRIHWMTDGQYDETEVPPGNMTGEPQGRPQSKSPPLHSGAWNQLKLSLQGNVASVTLNGEVVCERELEPANRRTFGLFHFADQTEVRVRNVVLRGDWAEILPSETDQPLADRRVADLDSGRNNLRAVFARDLTEVPDEFFRLEGSASYYAQTPAGLMIYQSSAGQWSQVSLIPRFSLHGDFDIETSFEQFNAGGPAGEPSIHLLAWVQNEPGVPSRSVRTVRLRTPQAGQQVKGQLVLQHADGTNQYVDSVVTDESTSGRLRLARRGKKVTMLFAQGDSPLFRIVGEHEAGAGEVPMNGVKLIVVASKGGICSVVWKSLTLRAERLRHLPPTATAERKLYVMKPDGSGLRELLAPPGQFTDLGSPEWSRDGRQIALDVSTGSVSTSHIFVVDVETKAAADLGPGCMPSFSRDGRQLAFSHPGQGIMTMDADGKNRRVVDAAGWGAQWSPDGRHIAYGKSGNIIVRNVATGEQKEILRGENGTRYSSVYWNLGWSHDSRSIAFKGHVREAGRDEVAVVNVEPPDRLQVLHSAPGGINADFTWSPDSRQVLFSLHSPAHQGPRLHVSPREGKALPALLPGQPADLKLLNCAWSREGLIAVTGERDPQPAEWPLIPEEHPPLDTSLPRTQR